MIFGLNDLGEIVGGFQESAGGGIQGFYAVPN
jgi:hypothetical protein